METAALIAGFEQLTEEAIDETLADAALYDQLDETQAILAMQRDILAAEEAGRVELAMAVATLAIRMHRRDGGR